MNCRLLFCFGLCLIAYAEMRASECSIPFAVTSSYKRIPKLRLELELQDEDGNKVDVRRFNPSWKDYFSGQRLICHLKQDQVCVFALFNYLTPNNKIKTDLAEARKWHAEFPGEHPSYGFPIVGHPRYFHVQVKQGKLEATFLGTEKDVREQTERGKILGMMLSCVQNPQKWLAISRCYRAMQKYDRAIEFQEKALTELQSRHAVDGVALAELCSIYSSCGSIEEALKAGIKAFKALKEKMLRVRLPQEEYRAFVEVIMNLCRLYAAQNDWSSLRDISLWAGGKEYAASDADALNLIGQAHEDGNNPANAYWYYTCAIIVGADDSGSFDPAPYFNILYLQTMYPERRYIELAKMQEYAIKVLGVPDHYKPLVAYKKAHVERYEAVLAMAQALMCSPVLSGTSQPLPSSSR